MARSSLELAKSLLRRRKFSLAITYLESRSDIYENDFEYLVTLGIACLYVGDVGNAMGYFGRKPSFGTSRRFFKARGYKNRHGILSGCSGT